MKLNELRALVRYAILENAKPKPKYDYGCAMLYFNFPKIKEIHELIDPQDIYQDESNPTFGLETEPHCTLLYGLHEEVSIKEITKVTDKFKIPKLKISNPSLFENEKFDVLKFDVGYIDKNNKILHKINKELTKYPNTQTYPDYHPHMTIAYLQSGKGKQYIEKLKESNYEEFEITPEYGVYSEPGFNKVKFNISLEK